jgi:hypothetical protein
VKNQITKGDIGKLFKRTMPGSKSIIASPHYLRVKEVEEIDGYPYRYICDIIRPGCDIARGASYCNMSLTYEEVNELEVLVVCGVVI